MPVPAAAPRLATHATAATPRTMITGSRTPEPRHSACTFFQAMARAGLPTGARRPSERRAPLDRRSLGGGRRPLRHAAMRRAIRSADSTATSSKASEERTSHT